MQARAHIDLIDISIPQSYCQDSRLPLSITHIAFPLIYSLFFRKYSILIIHFAKHALHNSRPYIFVYTDLSIPDQWTRITFYFVYTWTRHLVRFPSRHPPSARLMIFYVHIPLHARSTSHVQLLFYIVIVIWWWLLNLI